MYFPASKTIFIHVPKTGGNYFSRAFLSFSGDRMVLNAHQDGSDRFGVVGPFTARKHQSLAEYVTALGGDLTGIRVYAIARPPLERMLSLYFSPHRWMQTQEDGSARIRPADEISFDPELFRRLLTPKPKARGFVTSLHAFLDHENLRDPLSLDAPARHTSGAMVHLLSFAALHEECQRFARETVCEGAVLPERHVNASAKAGAVAELARRGDLAEMIAASDHALDLALFPDRAH